MRISPSHPFYDKINELMKTLSAIKNPQVHFNLAEEANRVEWKAYAPEFEEELVRELKHLISGGSG